MKNLIAIIFLLSSTHLLAKSRLETSGDVLHLVLPAVAFGTSIAFEDDYQGSWELIKSGVVSRVVVEGLKYSVDKERPDGSGKDSFPSGHAADTFAAATFIQQRYGWRWSIPFYIGASYVGYTRVASDRHYVEDVLAGAAIGALSSVYFTDTYKGVSITPIVGNGQYALYFSSKF